MEIPDDVRAAARKCLASWGPRGNIDLEAAISQALMAEREAQKERDAKIAKDFENGFSENGLDIAIAIRGDKPHGAR